MAQKQIDSRKVNKIYELFENLQLASFLGDIDRRGYRESLADQLISKAVG